jgi:group II intron reverse transcriptase/maturase
MPGYLERGALCNAFQHVKENWGSAGADGVTIFRFERHLEENIIALIQEIKQGTYSPIPLLKLLVDKGNGEARALCIPAVRDRVVQTAVLREIEPIMEKEFEDCNFGYRKGRSVKQAVFRIKDYFDQGYRWVVDADIDEFFDSVDHGLILEKVKRYIPNEDIVRLIELWIKAEVWDGKSITVIDRGIPQGSPLSPILANILLDELDEAFLSKGYKIVRYADDFIVLCKTPDKAQRALEFTNDILERLCLKLDEADVVSFDHGFKYLGVNFLRSMIFVPFERQKKTRSMLYYPPPLDMKTYFKNKHNSET